MKLRNFFWSVVCVLACSCACNNSAQEADYGWSEESEKPYEERQIRNSLKSFTYKEAKPFFPGCETRILFDYDVELPVKGLSPEVINVMQQNILSLAFNRTVSNTDWDSIVASNVERLVNDWKNSYLREVYEYGESSIMEQTDYIKGRMLDPYSGIVSYVCDAYGDGYNTYKRSINMDVRTGQIVYESNLFRSGYRPILRELLIEYLPNNVDKEYIDLNRFQPSDNFYITKAGITYIYPQGELGSMADGIIEVSIPWNAFTLLRVK